MLQQTLIWTALPRAVRHLPALGRPTMGLGLSVFISPRLHDDDPVPIGGKPPSHLLRDFPDMIDWPATLRHLTLQEQGFLVRFDGGPPLPARDVKIPLLEQPAASDLWKALFKEGTRVDSFQFDDFSERQWKSYPAGQLARSIREGYVDVTDAAAGGGVDLMAVVGALQRLLFRVLSVPPIGLPFPIPPIGLPGVPPRPGVPPLPGVPPIPGLPPIGGILGAGETPGEYVEGVDPASSVLPVLPPGVRSAVADLLDFHLPPLGPQPAEPDEEALRQLLDFHQMVAVLGEHPAIMRRLGLVVDIEVVVPVGLLGSLFPFRTVQVQPAFPPVLLKTKTVNYFPATSCRVDGDLFLAGPRPDDPETTDGLLRLDDDRYQVEQFDVEGAVFKIRGHATSVQAMAANLSPTMPREVSLPTLRSAGVSVFRDDRDQELEQASQQAAERNRQLLAINQVGVDSGGTGDPLFAEDVTVGYRVDVWDDVSARWHSLHDRQATYTFTAAATPVPPIVVQGDEGYVETAATERPEPSDDTSASGEDASGSLFVSPALVTWEGWSLSAPRPGNHIENPDPGERATKPSNTGTPTELKMTVETKATPKSLPRLRFGRRYRFRARAVDLAGNSRDLFGGHPDQIPQSTGELRYGRFEPVPSPPLILMQEPGGGESVDRVVARSDPLVAATLPAARGERYVVPPKVSQLMAERHGGFDGPNTMNPASHGVASREAASLPATIPAPTSATGKLTIPYLPDPMARGVLLVGLPGEQQRPMPDGSTAALTHVSFEGSWPDPAPFRLRIAGIKHDQAPKGPALFAPTSQDEAILHVEVPEAHTFTVRVSCHICRPAAPGAEPPPAELDRLHHMGMWQWIERLAPEVQKPRLRREAAQGRNWLLMPYREITFVHAVQRPVLEPVLVEDQTFTIGKDLGGTVALINVDAVVHGLSTSKVELLADWNDPLDDPTNEANNPLKDTVTRDANLGRRNTADADGRVTLPRAEHHFGDTRHHVVGYRALATTSFREYFPPTSEFTRPGPVVTKDVPSSARPLAPAIVSALPIFSWARTPTSSVRTARGVRVYLHRPWYSSGVGEKVAVVFVPGNPLADDDPRKPLVTAWAADPVWSSPVPPPLTGASFVGRDGAPVPIHPGLTLEELPPGMTVDAAEYEVDYDPDRKLWFSDVTLATGERYFPFVQLAVARFQPVSLPGVELSRVARTDFVQLPPDRRASVAVVAGSEAGAAQANFEVAGAVAHHTEGTAPGNMTVTSTLRTMVLKQAAGEGEWTVETDQVPTPFSDKDGVRTWAGTVPFRQEPGVRRKLVFQEIEAYRRNG